MRNPRAGILATALLMLLTFGIPSVQADSAQAKASAAAAEIIFDHDASDFTVFLVRDDGFLDITFAANTPDSVYSELLAKLRAHPDIKGLLAGRGGPICSRW